MLSKNIKKESYCIILKKKTFDYIKTSRLSSWMVASVFFLIGAWYSIRFIPFYESIVALISLGAILSSASWVNFVFDRELDRHAGEDISFFDNISPREILIISIISSLFGLFLLLFLNFFAFSVGLLFISVGFLYSAKPFRFKTRPPLDSISNALLFGILPITLGFSLNENLLLNQTIYVLLLIGSLIIISYYLLIDIFDIETDKKFGIETSCSKLGLKRAIVVALIMFFSSLLLSIVYLGLITPVSVSLMTCSPFMILLTIKNDFDSIRKILSLVSLIWTEIALFYLFILTNSYIPLIIFVLVFLSALYFLYVYFFIIKKSKTEKLH